MVRLSRWDSGDGMQEPSNAYWKVYRESSECLARLYPDEVAMWSGAVLDDKRDSIYISFLNTEYDLKLPNADIRRLDGKQVRPENAIVIIHYLLQSTGAALRGKLVPYYELPEGQPYYPAFLREAIKPLAAHFDGKGELLQAAAHRLGGHDVHYGDVAIQIPAFSRLPITCVLWMSDDESPASANILFDASAAFYLHTEDLAYVGQEVSRKLRQLAVEK